MLALIEPLEAEGTLVKRSRELLAEINFLVAGDASSAARRFIPFPTTRAPSSLCPAVAAEYRDAGYGERLLKSCEERAKSPPAQDLRAHHARRAWFLEQGFRAARSMRCLSGARRSTTGAAGSKVFSREYISLMARMVKCRSSAARPKGSISPLSRRARQAPLGERLEGSLGPVAQAADHAGEREPPQPRRPARAQVPHGTDRAPLLWRRRRRRLGLRPARQVGAEE